VKLIAISGVVAAALALAACGGGSSSSTSTGAAPATTAAAAATSGKSAPERFRDGLVTDKGFTEQQATCIEEGVLRKLGRKQFDALYGAGSTPTSVQTTIMRVAAKCAPRGPGQ
jgi:hypothetical protein